MKLQLGFAGERYIYLPLHIIKRAKSHPMTSGLYIKFLGHFVNAKFHYINRPEGSDDHIFIYCREGSGWLELAGEKYKIEKNSFIIIPPHVPHKYGADNDNPWSIYWLHFQGSNAKYMSHPYYAPCELVESPTSRIDERLELFEEIYQVLSTEQSEEYYCYANSCFIHFLSTLIYVKVYREVKEQRLSQNHVEGEQVINRLTHYMNENIDGKLSVNDLSTYVGLSASHLHRIFVKYFGMSPMNYFSKIKMNKACDLLLTTPLKINQIAAKLSYKDSLYFSRIFKKVIGISPKSFRDKILK